MVNCSSYRVPKYMGVTGAVRRCAPAMFACNTRCYRRISPVRTGDVAPILTFHGLSSGYGICFPGFRRGVGVYFQGQQGLAAIFSLFAAIMEIFLLAHTQVR